MANGSLIAALAKVGSDDWLSSERESERVEWLPLVQISHTGIWIGLDRSGEWVLGRLGEGLASSSGTPPQPWVTMLDANEAEFRESLSQAASRFGLPIAAIQDMVPIDDVLAMAIKSESSHWADRAVTWMLVRTVRDEDIDLLRELTNAKWASQRTRHAARHLVKLHDRQ